jgi:hypothetical protein
MPNRGGESLSIIQIFEDLMPSALRAMVNLAQGSINAFRPWWSMAGGGVVFGVLQGVSRKKSVHARFCPLSTLSLSFPASLACILCLSHLPLLPASLSLPSFPSSFAASLACLAWTGPLQYAAPPGII